MSLECIDVSFAYGSNAAAVLRGCNISVSPGEIVVLAGANGCGKSTLLKALAGLLSVQQGRVLCDGIELTQLQPCERIAQVAWACQQPERQLFAATALDDVMFGPLHLGLDVEEAQRRAQEALRDFCIDSERAAECAPFEFSGGEQRRIALAGVVACGSHYLVLDEPFAGLDAEQRFNLGSQLKALAARGVGIALSCHDLAVALEYADVLALMADGTIGALGKPTELLEDAELLKSCGLEQPSLARIACRFDAPLGADVSVLAAELAERLGANGQVGS